MNQYDVIFNSEEAPLKKLHPKEGVVAIALIATVCDSHISLDDVDINRLVDKLWKTGFFKDYSGDELLTMVEGFLDQAEERGLGVLFNAAYGTLKNKFLPQSFAIGVLIVLDDFGIIPTQKQQFIQELQQALNLEGNQAQQIINDVTVTAKTAAGQDNILYLG